MTRLHTRASSFLLAQHYLLKTHLPADTTHTCTLTLKHKQCLMLELGNVSRAPGAPFVPGDATAPLDQETCTLPQPADRHQDKEEPGDVLEQPVDPPAPGAGTKCTAPEEQPGSTLSPAEKVPTQTPGLGYWLAGLLAGRSASSLKRASHTSSSGPTLPSCLQLLPVTVSGAHQSLPAPHGTEHFCKRNGELRVLPALSAQCPFATLGPYSCTGHQPFWLTEGWK